MISPHPATTSSGFSDERLVSHVEARRQQRVLELFIDGPFNTTVSLMLDRLNAMSITTSTGEGR